MGMAASQARYLSLSARKTNCEYEGQQINQQRLMLSNQSADLFNQMLTMAVPTPPKTTDYTKLQYSWSDGNNTSVIENFYQLGEPQEDFNYVVTSYHYENVYTGQKKALNDPQIKAKRTDNFTTGTKTFTKLLEKSYKNETSTGARDDYYELKLEDANGNEIKKKLTRAYGSTTEEVGAIDAIYKRTVEVAATTAEFSETNGWKVSTSAFNALGANGTTTGASTSIPADSWFTEVTSDADKSKLKESYGAEYDKNKKYYQYTPSGSTYTFYVCGDDLAKAKGNSGDAAKVTVRSQDLSTSNRYYTDGQNYVTGAVLSAAAVSSSFTFQTAENNPTFSDYSYVGNCEISQIDTEQYDKDATIDVEIQQLLKDLGSSDGDEISAERLRACFNNAGEYISGSLYSFTMNGKRYFTTAADMDESLLSAYKSQIADNTIDGQQNKLSYYNSTYINTKISEVKKAMLETDGQGRFSTAKFEDDSVVYTLNVETITDEDAYNDAMNQYYYKQEEYDKQVADINAKTEILQAEDRKLQLKLEQLNTEQSALQTEMEACQKVVSKNVEGSFKTFGG